MADIDNKIRELANKTIDSSQYELVDVRIVGGRAPVIQVFIDKPGGIKVEDCALVSRSLEKELDKGNFVAGSYTLEVSSPGAERPLVAGRDYAKYIGSKAKVITKEKIDNQKKFKGTIVKADDKGVTLSMDGTEKKLSYSAIDRANLVVEFG